jgi:hypothetical protein
MPRPTDRSESWGSTAALATTLGVLVVALGSLFVFVPYLIAKRDWRASVTDATPIHTRIFATTPTYIPARAQACVTSVTVTPNSGSAAFQIVAIPGTETRSWPLALTIDGPGYHTVGKAVVVGGFGGREDFQIRPPKRTLLATACVRNDGTSPVALDGTPALFTTSRSQLSLNGKRVPGDLMLTFYERRRQSRLAHLGAVVEHVSNLTDRLVPTWLVWVLLVGGFFALPAGVVWALRRSLQEGEVAA